MASKHTSKKAATKKVVLGKSAPKPATKTKKAEKAVSKPAPKKVKEKPVPKAALVSPLKPAVKPVMTPVEAAIVAKVPEIPPVVAPKVIPPSKSSTPASIPLTISVQTSQGAAANGNTHPANLLVIVTCAGAPVVELTRDHFTLMEHFEVPGQGAPFSNSISSFRNAGTGAYLLQTKPITGAPWRSGHHLGQLLISDDEERQGQAAFKLIIK